jgi:DNA-binding NarL/FixJ family response regulator
MEPRVGGDAGGHNFAYHLVPMIARGMVNKQIASELGISPATVRTHIYNLFQKAGATSRIGLLNALRAP